MVSEKNLYSIEPIKLYHFPPRFDPHSYFYSFRQGISFRQCKALGDDESTKANSIKEEQVRTEETRRMCSFVDCSRSEAQEACPIKCFGSIIRIVLILLHIFS